MDNWKSLAIFRAFEKNIKVFSKNQRDIFGTEDEGIGTQKSAVVAHW